MHNYIHDEIYLIYYKYSFLSDPFQNISYKLIYSGQNLERYSFQ